MRRSTLALGRFLALTLGVWLAAPTHAQTWVFTRLVDLSDTNPTTGFTWIDFEPPAIHRDQVGFRGDATGVYRADLLGNVSIIADENTTSPSFGGGLLSDFATGNGRPHLHGDEAGFLSASAAAGSGAYRGSAPTNLVVAGDEFTRFPGQPFGNNISFFKSISFDGRVAVTANDSTPFNPESGAFIESIGLGIRPGALATIVDTLTPVANESAPYFTVTEVHHARGSAAYTALRSNPTGPRVLRRWSAYRPADHTLIADTSTLIPGGGGARFDFMGRIAVDRLWAQDVCFFGTGPNQSIEGIYVGDGSNLNVIADTFTQAPGSTADFDFFSTCAIDAGNIAFSATDTNFGSALYYKPRIGSLQRIVGDGDMIDGQMIFGVQSGDHAIDGNRVAFLAFTSTGAAIYVGERTGAGVPVAGDSQANPILPDSISGGTFTFTSAPSGTWIDPPTENGFRYTMTGGSLFTEILDFPDGFGAPFRVVANGQELGAFGPGDSLTFPGAGVTSFDVLEILPGVDAEDGEAFPLQLAFDTPTADLEMIALPEPAGAIWPGLVLVTGLAWRRSRSVRRRAVPVAVPLCIASAVLLVGDAARAQSLTFTRIADFSTPIPGDPLAGTFNDFKNAEFPAIDARAVAFQGGRGMLMGSLFDYDLEGIYTTLGGGLSVVADSNTPIPGGTGNFGTPITGGFTGPTISGNDIAFKGEDEFIFQRGIYASFGGTLVEIASKSPSGFSTLGSPSISGGNVSYWTFLPFGGSDGIYRHLGGLTGSSSLVANENSLIPGRGPFSSISSSSADQDGTQTAFIGQGGTPNLDRGIYLSPSTGVLTTVADGTTPIPNSTSNFDFSFVTQLSFDQGSIAFAGNNGVIAGSFFTEAGIFRWDGSSFEAVVDQTTLIPGTTQTFAGFGNVSLDDPDVAFVGFDAALDSGLYATDGGPLLTLLEVGDTLDGRTVTSIGFGHEGYDDGEATFLARFSDGTEGIYVVTIPEPGASPTLGAGLLLTAALRRRRSRA